MFPRFMAPRKDRFVMAAEELVSKDTGLAGLGLEEYCEGPRNVVKIDKDGDLRLDVGADHSDGPVSYRVCSKTLDRRLPIFKAMLFGYFAESNAAAEGEWVVQLPDDHPHGFGIVMDIIHSNFEDVPIFFREVHPGLPRGECLSLYEIARMTDKYKMVDVVRPWINMWLMEASTHHVNLHEPCFHGQLIWVAWTFGAESLLAAELDGVVSSARIHEKERGSFCPADEQPKSGDDAEPKSGYVHQNIGVDDCSGYWFSLYGNVSKHTILDNLDVADDIMKVRLQALQSLLDLVVSFLKQPVKCIELGKDNQDEVHQSQLDKDEQDEVYAPDWNYQVVDQSQLGKEKQDGVDAPNWNYRIPSKSELGKVDNSDCHCKVVYQTRRHGEQAFLLPFPPETTPKTLGDFLPKGTVPEAGQYHGSVIQLHELLHGLSAHFPFNWIDTRWRDMIDLRKELDMAFKSRPKVVLSKEETQRLAFRRKLCGLKDY